MITRENFQQIKGHSVEAAGQNLIAHLAAYGLKPSVNMANLKRQYRQLLFDQLLAVDAGLKMRHDLARTAEAREQLKEQAVNLDGYKELDEAARLIVAYERAYNNLFIGGGNNPFKNHGISPEEFLAVHEASIEKAFGDKVIDLSENPTYQKLEQLRDLLNELVQEGVLKADAREFHPSMHSLLPMDPYKKRVDIDDSFVYHKLTRQ